MSRLEKFKKTTSLSELAHLLGYKPSAVSYILYKIPEEDKYIEFEIPKKSGDARSIKAPTDKLKQLQRRLADLLNESFDEICSKNKQRKSLSHGFRRNHSIITNARNHKNKRHVFNIDLQDFFPSINFGRIRGFFIKNNHFNLGPKAATVIAQIACHDNKLPQGSPCSPIISNLIGHLLDIRMVNLAKKTKCTYSRYADDLTFSTNKKNFPEKIAIMKNENDWIAGKFLIKEIEKVGFSLNEKKTSMQYRTSRQMTTGLIVNKKINIKREYYKKARSMCHELFKSGEFYTGKKMVLSEATSNKPEIADKENGTLNQLEGILSFIYQIKRPHDIAKWGERRFHPTDITKLYRNFLFYKHFFSTITPLVVCEGKTDIIYLKTALKQLAKEYNEFVEIKDNVTEFKIKFLNMSKNFLDVFAISTGTSGLGHLLKTYEKDMGQFAGEGKQNPIIMLMDNDDGSEEIKKQLNEDELKSKTFCHYAENLYLLFVPKNDDKAIEDLFDDEILKIKIDGKVFNRGKEIDTKKEYGKIVFAEKVIREKQKDINFDGFKEVFDNFKLIINDYRKKNA